jgi:hypothetical protein
VVVLNCPRKEVNLEIFVFGSPELVQIIYTCAGLASNNNFAGSLKYVFYNDISIIYELKKSNPKVHYIGVLDPEFYDTDVELIPITFSFPSSHIWWPNREQHSLNISFDFKSGRSMGVLAYCDIVSNTAAGYWVVS